MTDPSSGREIAAVDNARRSVRQFTYEEATQLTDLSFVAVGEVDPGAGFWPLEWGGRWGVGISPRSRMNLKATRLALMKLVGPGAEVSCDVHQGGIFTGACGGVTVTDALLGRTCHKAAPCGQRP